MNAVDPDGMDYIITINRDKDGNITGITFSATVYITGDGANQKRADELDALAKKTYTTKEINGVSVGFNVNYEYSDKVKGIGDVGEQEGANVLYFESGDGVSGIIARGDMSNAGDFGTIYNSEDSKRSNSVIIHETAHLLGFEDKYVEWKNKKGERVGRPLDGYKNDLMGTNAPNLVKSHYQQMYNYVVTPERRENDNLIRRIYFPDLAIKILNRTNKTIGNKFIDKTN